MESQIQPIVFTINNADNLYRNRHTTTVSFAVGILLFLLPFTQVKCGSMTLASNTGLGIAIGKEWKVAMGGGSDELMKKANSLENGDNKNPMKSGPNIFVIMALAAGFAGFFIAFSSFKLRQLAGMYAGILAFIMLIAMMVQFNLVMKSALSEKNPAKELNMDMGMLIKVKFTIWYYISLAASVAAFFSYKHYKIEKQDAIDRVIDFEFQQKKQEG